MLLLPECLPWSVDGRHFVMLLKGTVSICYFSDCMSASVEGNKMSV